MNDFGVNLQGLRAIYSETQFWKKGAPESERTFICEGGPGCEAKGGGLPGLLFGARTVKVRFNDGAADTISSHSIAAYISANGKTVPKPADGLATVDDIAHVVRLAGEEPKVFIPVKPAPQAKESPTGRLAKTAPPNLQNIPIRTEMGAEIRKAFVASTKAESPTDRAGVSAPAAPRQDRAAIVASAEFIALFEATRAAFKDPNRATCKRGHPISAENAHVGDLRRPPHRYSCDPCLRKVPPAPGFSE